MLLVRPLGSLRGWLIAPLLLSVCGQPITSTAADPPPLRFRQSGLAGGGFINVVETDPTGSGLVIAGGDVSGFHRSVDGGRTWETANAGLTSSRHLSVAAIEISRSDPATIYAGVGVRGQGGGLVVSTDRGRTWSLRSSIHFSGSNNDGVPPLPSPHPRSTGDLLALDEGRGLLYAATFDQGVLRSDDGGRTWTTLGLQGKFLRGLEIDPAEPTTVYVAAYGDGVHRISSAHATATVEAMPGSPTFPEELAASGGRLFVAAGPDGVSVRGTDGSWTQLNASVISTSGPSWLSIDAYEACGRTVVYAGADRAGANSIVRSVDGGATWASLTAEEPRVHDTLGGPDGVRWWLAAQRFLFPGGGFFTAAQISHPAGQSLDTCVADRVLVAGRSGVWGSGNAGQDWYPFMEGLGVTIARGVAADPRVAGRVHVVTADWVYQISTDGGDRVVMDKPPVGQTAADVVVESGTSPGRVYVASGNPSSNTQGEVYSAADPLTGGWTDEGLSSVAGGRRPLAIAVRRVAGRRVLIAAVERSGIWRKEGTRWARVNGVAMAQGQPTRSASIVWGPSGAVYLYDHQTGVWRSTDNGRRWTKIWSKLSTLTMTGFLELDPGVTTRLYVSVGGEGVFRLDRASTGTVEGGAIVPDEVGDFRMPGPLEVGPEGALHAVESAGPTSEAGIFRSVDGGATWELVSDPVFPAMGGFPSDLSIGPDGRAYLSLNGNGLVVGVPA